MAGASLDSRRLAAVECRRDLVGLPGGSWAPDELTPAEVLGGAAQWFAHGWYDRYPPFHFYVLTAAFSPVIALEWLGRVDLTTTVPYAILHLVGRGVSLAMALGTLLALYACGSRTFGRRAGIFAAAAFAVLTPFVYYAKTANLDVPYLFWFALSLVFYLRVLDRLAFRDFVAFAACATLAICTKDQAYGLYLLIPFALVERLWRTHRAAGASRPFTRALCDPRLRWAALVAIVLFFSVHNVLFNARGFRDHIGLITGTATRTYRDFAPTLTGRLALLRLSVDLVRAGVGLADVPGRGRRSGDGAAVAAHRRATLWLMLPIISYYVGFVDVVLYNYDRFMLPVCLVLAMFAGFACDRWLLLGSRARGARVAALAAVFACTLLYAATVDFVMLRDSRYTVEQWLIAHVKPTESLGWVFPGAVLPVDPPLQPGGADVSGRAAPGGPGLFPA